MATGANPEIAVLAECVLRLDHSARRDFARLKALERLVHKKLDIQLPSGRDGA